MIPVRPFRPLPRGLRKPVALAAVFLIKLGAIAQLTDHPLLQVDAGLDTTAYIDLARRVAAGDLLLGPGLYFVSPLYIYFLAGILAVTDSLTAVRVVQALLGTLAVAFVFEGARQWFGERAAWVAGSLAGLTGLFTFYELLVLQAALDPFLVSAGLCALAIGLRSESARWLSIAGIAFGLEALNRPNSVVAAIGIAGLMVLMARRRRMTAVFVAGFVLALAPLIVRNGVVAGYWWPSSSHGGLNFYIGNNPQADGTYRSVPGITPNIAGQQADARRVAEQASGASLDDSQVSAYFYRQGVDWIRSAPPAAVALFVRKLHYTLAAAHLPLNYSYPFFAYDMRTVLAVLAAGPWLLVPLGIVGLASARPEGRREYLIWVAFVPLYVLAVAIFFAAERYRLPLLPPLCIGAGAALSGIYDMFRRREWWRMTRTIGAATVIALVSNWPVGLDDGRSEARVRMAERLIQRDQLEEAERWTTAALDRQHPTPGIVHFRIGRALAARGSAAAAVRHLEQAARLDPERGETSYALGQALLDAGRSADAVPHLKRAFEAGVRPDLSGFDLARAQAASGDRAAALQTLARVRPARRDDAKSWFALGQLARELGNPALALNYYREAARAAPADADPQEQVALALAALGDYEQALTELRRAAALDPSDASVRLNLAVALAQLGRIAEARVAAREALQLNPNYERAREFLRLLER